MRIFAPKVSKLTFAAGASPSESSFTGSFTGSLVGSLTAQEDIYTTAQAGFTGLQSSISGSFAGSGSAHTQRGALVSTLSGSAHTDRVAKVGAISSSLDTRIKVNETFKTQIDSAITVSGANTTLLGNLTVQGTQTSLDTATLNVADLNILVASGAADAASANGAGLTVDGADATLTYVSTGDKWAFNKDLDITGSLNSFGSQGQVNTLTGITRFNNGLGTDQWGNISSSNSFSIYTDNGLTLRNGDGNNGGFLSLNSGGVTLGGDASDDVVTIGNTGNKVKVGGNAGYGREGQNIEIGATVKSTGTETAGDVLIFSTGGTNGTAGKITLNGAEIQVTGSIKALNDVIVTNDVQADSIGIGTAASGTTGEIRATGDITAYYSSDERLKENFTPLTGALDKVKAIGGYEFDWKDGIEDVVSKTGHDIGVKAQELQAQYPELVHERDNGYLAVDYIKLNAVLIEAVKELAAKVDELSK
jgi:hypothetical protein